jgi:hypothetical protein
MGEIKMKFISYDGKYPNLCSGKLIIKIEEKDWEFPKYSLSSGGSVSFTKDWDPNITDGPWSINNWPEGFPEDKKIEVIEMINDEISHGCCGGCI